MTDLKLCYHVERNEDGSLDCCWLSECPTVGGIDLGKPAEEESAGDDENDDSSPV